MRRTCSHCSSRVLDHSNPSQAAAGLDKDERGLTDVETPSGIQKMLIVSESGLYALILRSRKLEVRAFRRWVTSELLPTLRRSGSYALDGRVRALEARVVELGERKPRPDLVDWSQAYAAPEPSPMDWLRQVAPGLR